MARALSSKAPDVIDKRKKKNRERKNVPTDKVKYTNYIIATCSKGHKKTINLIEYKEYE